MAAWTPGLGGGLLKAASGSFSGSGDTSALPSLGFGGVWESLGGLAPPRLGRTWPPSSLRCPFSQEASGPRPLCSAHTCLQVSRSRRGSPEAGAAERPLQLTPPAPPPSPWTRSLCVETWLLHGHMRASGAGSHAQASRAPSLVRTLCPVLSRPRPPLRPQLGPAPQQPGTGAVASWPCPPGVHGRRGWQSAWVWLEPDASPGLQTWPAMRGLPRPTSTPAGRKPWAPALIL